MADESVVSDIVSKFLLNTCRLRPQLSRHVVQAAQLCAGTAAHHPPDDTEDDHVSLITGSAAEFYIEPMLPHVGDIDVMYHHSTRLAIPRGHPPPTQLPAEFSNYVKVVEIVDSHLPGYVYLELRYLLTQCIDDDKYNYIEYDRGQYFANVTIDDNLKSYCHGPAFRPTNIVRRSLLSADIVRCVRCLSWPSQAADWPTRHRNYDWPDSATVDHVVNNGCDVVHVAHRQCRQHKWMGKHQHRLSFSRAEIVLINDWMPLQQIVYHILRFFMRTKRLIDSADNSERVVVSNYHIKTLMLWTCELKPRSWWTENLNLVRICVELLHTLSVWLTDTCCPHYFINNCNLVDNSLSVGMVACELMSVDEAFLSTWFVYEYIGECAALCTPYVLRLFDDATSITKLHNAVSAIVDFRLKRTVLETCLHVQTAVLYLSSFTHRYGLTVQSYFYLMNEFTKCDGGVYIDEYFLAVALLHVAHKISISGFNDDLTHFLATILGQYDDTPRHSKQRGSASSLNTAAKLMKVVAKELHNTVQVIEIELSKAYLHRALRCKDSDSDSIYCLANVYLAVLYYTTGQYQTAIDHCTLVTRSQDHSQCSSHVVQGELLPKIDDDIDTVLGLTVFYQYVRTAALNQRQTQHVSVLTTEIFAYYLHCSLLSVTQSHQVARMSLPDVSQRCSNYFSEIHQLFIGDALVCKRLHGALQQNISDKQELWSKCVQSSASKTEPNTSELVELLQRSAVEHMTAQRQLEAREFGSVGTTVTTDFEALYAYKHGDYQRCLQLSTQNVHTLLFGVHMVHVVTFPEFIQLLDDDIVSLTALTLIVNPECRDEGNTVCITQLTLSLYLMTQCQLKLRHSVTSLAQTLDYVKVAQRRIPADWTLDQLTLKLIARKTHLLR